MVHHGEPDPNVAGEHHGWVRQFSEISRGVCDNIQGGIQVLHLGSVDLDLSSSPCWLVSYCSYLLPKQGGGTYRIQVNPTKVHDRNSKAAANLVIAAIEHNIYILTLLLILIKLKLFACLAINFSC